jgi:hypothetical protein
MRHDLFSPSPLLGPAWLGLYIRTNRKKKKEEEMQLILDTPTGVIVVKPRSGQASLPIELP